jgi:DNA repair protein RecO (recombination protein O)
MLQNTRGIVLRSIKYGETSLVSKIFTESFGVQSYIIQGIRTSGRKQSRAGLLQPSSLLELTVYQKANKNLLYLKEFQAGYFYQTVQQEVVKNTIALFSIELLLRLLPEHAPLPELFEFSFNYFQALDRMPVNEVANFPLYFIIQCSNLLGYELKGRYSDKTSYLNLQEGGFSEKPPVFGSQVTVEDAVSLDRLLIINDPLFLNNVDLNAPGRFRLLTWYLDFLHQHSQHLSAIKSLEVLKSILH